MLRVINEVLLLGNMVTDANWKDPTETSQGRVWFKFALSSEEPGGKATILDVIAWDKNAENLAQRGRKGKQLFIRGKLESHKGSLYVVIDRLTFGADSKKQQQPRQMTPEPVPTANIYKDEDAELYTYPVQEEEIVEDEAVPQEEKEEIANVLVDMGFDADRLERMLMKLTREALKDNT